MSGLILKVLGSLFIIVSGFMVSKSFTDKLKADIRFSDGLLSGFVSLEEYICGMLIPADEAFLLAAEDAGDARDIFVSVANSAGTPRDCFSKALRGSDKAFADAVCGFVQGICSSDERERRTAFSIIRTRLTVIRDNAELEYKRLGKLYSTAGILGGLVIVILLL